jgi:hypothetical protein
MKKETSTVETDEDGTIRYYNAEDELHNPNGPAVVHTNGGKSYWIKGQRHNPDGPAIVSANGYKAYFVKGQPLTEAEFKTWQTQQTAPLHNKTKVIDGIEYKLTAI